MYTRQAVHVILGWVFVTITAWKSNRYYTFWVCVCRRVCPVVEAHAPYYIVSCGQSCYTIFFTLAHKRHDFQINLLNIKCVLELLFETLPILRRIIEILWYTYVGLHVNYPLFFSDFDETRIFWIDFREIFMWYDMKYLLTASGYPPGGSSTVHIYTQTHTHT